ncbi:MAG TPA: polyprenyl synthetase family protein [Kofleriaceae bacterium]
MKPLANLESIPSVLGVLERAFGEHGTSALDRRVPDVVWRRALSGPAEEFLSRPGKQLRSAMVSTGWLLAERSDDATAQRLGMIVELIHAGSLVIDDVEDDSHERRGGPALHDLFGVPLAINTGSWMYFLALAEISALGLPAANELAVYRAACTTLVRCHQGQALDLSVRIPDLALPDVPAVVDATTRLKTGALCAFATSIGAHAAGTAPDVVEAAAKLGTVMGVALQMLDDLGSLKPARRAKGREDLRGRRPTWPWAWLAETQPFAWSRLVARANAAHDDAELDAVADALVAEIDHVGRARIRALLDDALADLVARAGTGPAIATIGAALSQMETSYG